MQETDYVCGDLYDSPDGTTYVCAMPESHPPPWHIGIRQGHPPESTKWYDDDPHRRVNRQS